MRDEPLRMSAWEVPFVYAVMACIRVAMNDEPVVRVKRVFGL